MRTRIGDSLGMFFFSISAASSRRQRPQRPLAGHAGNLVGVAAGERGRCRDDTGHSQKRDALISRSRSVERLNAPLPDPHTPELVPPSTANPQRYQ